VFFDHAMTPGRQGSGLEFSDNPHSLKLGVMASLRETRFK